MRRDFIHVNLRPKYIPNKYISYVVNTLGIVVVVLFVLFYLVYLPYRDVTKNLEKATFENQNIKNEITFVSSLIEPEVVNSIDTIYIDTIDYVDSTVVPLRLRLSELYSSTPPGATLESVYFSLNKEVFEIDVTVDSDETLLMYIETLWEMYWIDNVEFTEAGPGSIELTISLDVGDYNE